MGNVQGNSAKTIQLRFNTHAEGAVDFLKQPVTINLDHGLISETPAGSPMPRQDFSLGAQTARYVEMRVTDNWYVAQGDGTAQDEHGHFVRGGDRVGLGEVRFSAVPEPGAFALLSGGLMLLTTRGVRRRSVKSRL